MTKESKPKQTTRRAVIRGAGVTGLLTMGVGTATVAAAQSEENEDKEETQQQSASRGKGRRLPDKAAEKAKDIIDIKFPGKDNGNGGDDGSGGIDG